MKQVFVLKAFQFAFVMIRKNFSWVAVISLINMLLQILYLLPYYLFPTNPENFSLLTLLFIIPEIMIDYMLIKLALLAYDREGRKVSHREAGFPGMWLIWQMIAVSLIFVALLILGLIALVFPFFVVLTTYLFVMEVLIDSNEDISSRRVFRISGHLTEGVKWRLMGFIAIIAIPFLINFALGSLGYDHHIVWVDAIIILTCTVVLPIQLFSTTYLYKSLKQQSEQN